MGEGNVDLVHAVLKALQVIARHVLGVPDLNQPFGLAMGKMREQRRFAVAEIGKHQVEIFARGKSLERHFAGETGFLGGLMNALPELIELPAVIDATDRIVLDPAEMQRRAAMRTA